IDRRHPSKSWLPSLGLREKSSEIECGGSPTLQEALGVQVFKDFDQCRDHTGPSGLMASTNPRSVVAMKVLVKQQVISPVGIILKLLSSAEHRSSAISVVQKDARQSGRDFTRNLEQVH